MDYTIKRPFRGKARVLYRCPACDADLASPLVEAGTTQPCPACKAALVTPGEKELAEQRAAKKEAETAETKRLLARMNGRQPHQREVSSPGAVELVWYGRMHCKSCGYFWTSRRSTPPAKCAGCSSRNIVPIRQRKRTIGCLGMIGLVLLIALVLLIFIAMSGPHGSGRDNYVNGYNRANGTHVNGYWRR